MSEYWQELRKFVAFSLNCVMLPIYEYYQSFA